MCKVDINLRPADIIALVAIVGCFVLMYFEINGTVSVVLLGISAYYFGHRRIEIKETKKKIKS